jgi:hypothetical protein
LERKQKEGESVNIYTYELMNLAKHANDSMTDKEKLSYFIRGLLPTLQSDVITKKPATLNEAIEFAKVKEIALKQIQTLQGNLKFNEELLKSQQILLETMNKLVDKVNIITSSNQFFSKNFVKQKNFQKPSSNFKRNERTLDGKPICKFCKKTWSCGEMV